MTDEDARVRCDVEGPVATIALTRPDRRNAQTPLTWMALRSIGAELPDDVRVVVVRGEGASFSAGLDRAMFTEEGLPGVPSMLDVVDAPTTAAERLVAGFQEGFTWLSRPDVVSVAAVQGHAIGAGFQLALACDIRIASEDARFAMLEVRFGLIPDLGGLHRLSRAIGPARTKEIVWTGRNVEAEEAERLGILNRVVSADTLEKETESYARELVNAPPLPLSLTKTLIGRGHETSLEASLERDAQSQAACIESEDHREAVEAYLEKRPARFHGR